MSDGIKAMWEDAEDYERLAEKYGEKVRCGSTWPYNADWKHYGELEQRERNGEEGVVVVEKPEVTEVRRYRMVDPRPIDGIRHVVHERLDVPHVDVVLASDYETLEIACEENTDLINELRTELQIAKQRQISGFYEEEYPIYTQGEPTHELQEYVTAEGCTHVMEMLKGTTKDAQRYRWLRDSEDCPFDIVEMLEDSHDSQGVGKTLDANIDAAMENERRDGSAVCPHCVDGAEHTLEHEGKP